jgi:hypothetical protein
MIDAGLDESRSWQGGADRLRAVPQFQPSGTRFEQERREHEEVLAADERDLDIGLVSQAPLEVPRGRDATKSSAEYDNAHDSPGERVLQHTTQFCDLPL